LYTTNAEVDEFVVKARAPSLFSVNKKGKMRNSTVKWRIRYRADGAADWTYYPAVAAGGVDAVDSWMRLSARSKSEVLTSKTIAVGTKDNYEIQVQRYNPATNATDEQNPFKTSHITEITYNNLSYPNTAMLALRVKATDQLSGSFPNIGTLVRGLKVRVPDLSNGGAGDKEFENYYWTGTGNNFNVLADDSDPVTWNGTSYITQYTSNPAYVIRDFLLNDRYGLGDVVDATDIDNSSFDTVGKKCWQKYQSKHKHTLNLTIDSQTNPGDILAQMAKVSRIFLFWSIGYIKMKYEEDEDATQLFNMSSVVEGNFSTTYIAQSKLPNILEVTYANADDGWAKDTRELVDESEWALGRPHRKITWNIKGITDTDMALREAKIMLNKAKLKRRSITFKTTLQGVACEPGDDIAFQHDTPPWGWGGRAQSSTPSTIVLDQHKSTARR
jgi:predicted phage tail protein